MKNFLYKVITHGAIKRREEARRSFFQKTEQITKKSDKQNIFSEALAFPLQLALHERLVSAHLTKFWHDPSTLCPSETLTKLWEYSDGTLGVTCKTTAEDESFCSHKSAPSFFFHLKEWDFMIITSSTKCLSAGKSSGTIPTSTGDWHTCVSEAVTLKSYWFNWNFKSELCFEINWKNLLGRCVHAALSGKHRIGAFLTTFLISYVIWQYIFKAHVFKMTVWYIHASTLSLACYHTWLFI